MTIFQNSRIYYLQAEHGCCGHHAPTMCPAGGVCGTHSLPPPAPYHSHRRSLQDVEALGLFHHGAGGGGGGRSLRQIMHKQPSSPDDFRRRSTASLSHLAHAPPAGTAQLSGRTLLTTIPIHSLGFPISQFINKPGLDSFEWYWYLLRVTTMEKLDCDQILLLHEK